jgi:uncharacterized protein with GYD domain
MATFIMSLNWTDQGIRNVKDSPKRAKAARELAGKVGVEIKQLFLTSGDADLVLVVDTPDGDNVAKFAMALGSRAMSGAVQPGPGTKRNIKSSSRNCLNRKLFQQIACRWSTHVETAARRNLLRGPTTFCCIDGTATCRFGFICRLRLRAKRTGGGFHLSGEETMKTRLIAVVTLVSLSSLAMLSMGSTASQAQHVYHRAPAYHHYYSTHHSTNYHNERHSPNPYHPGYTMGRHSGE